MDAQSFSRGPFPAGLLGSVLEQQDTHHQVGGNYFRLSFASPHRGGEPQRHRDVC